MLMLIRRNAMKRMRGYCGIAGLVNRGAMRINAVHWSNKSSTLYNRGARRGCSVVGELEAGAAGALVEMTETLGRNLVQTRATR